MKIRISILLFALVALLSSCSGNAKYQRISFNGDVSGAKSSLASIMTEDTIVENKIPQTYPKKTHMTRRKKPNHSNK